MPSLSTPAAPVDSTAEIRARLESRLRAVHVRLRPADDPGPFAGGDVADRVAHEALRALTAGSCELLVTRERHLVDALARLDAGEYGICADCGQMIAPKRLAAAPEARRCIECEAARERLKGQDTARPVRWDPAAWNEDP